MLPLQDKPSFLLPRKMKALKCCQYNDKRNTASVTPSLSLDHQTAGEQRSSDDRHRPTRSELSDIWKHTVIHFNRVLFILVIKYWA